MYLYTNELTFGKISMLFLVYKYY